MFSAFILEKKNQCDKLFTMISVIFLNAIFDAVVKNDVVSLMRLKSIPCKSEPVNFWDYLAPVILVDKVVRSEPTTLRTRLQNMFVFLWDTWKLYMRDN